ncbi:histidine utilization repressor [Seongchinamella sediminis]|uniref:Histidine utilization repressor n=1 Tax=Seongchinamella sediminis TaxID=2283635 RepID=A0A3L7DV10_9GAMM|nr:histidine utilization repressor [Seongchinamella sediminis]RLQ20359.1 histidine utilization repressor [Seongchinamella sediminis]
MTAPQYERIKAALRLRIQRGDLCPGDRVPSENQLVVDFGVSRMTARRALLELAEDGLLARTQGLGTFVADNRPVSSVTQIRNIAEEIGQRGHRHSCQVLVLESREADPALALQLGVAAGERIFHSVLVHREDGVPVQWESRQVVARLAPGYLEQDFTRVTPSAFLSAVAPLTEADQTVEAVLPTAAIAAELEMDLEQPCLKIIRRTFSHRGVVSLAELIHPGDRYRLGSHIDS